MVKGSPLLLCALLLVLSVPAWCGDSDRIGVTHWGGKYNFSAQDYMSEGADALAVLGTRTIKVCANPWGQQDNYPFNSTWPATPTLKDLLQVSYMQALFARPFRTYILEAFQGQCVCIRDGMDGAETAVVENDFYEATAYLLRTYQGTGKRFILQNWEGDWAVRDSYDMNVDPTPLALAGMTAYANARQAGIDRARAEFTGEGVEVYGAIEVNLVRNAMAGRPSVTNDVLPNTHCDLYSYSAWDTLANPSELSAAIEYIRTKAPDSAAFGNNNVYLGEFGWPEYPDGPAAALAKVQEMVGVAKQLDIPHAVYWEIYCNVFLNEPPPGERPTNGDMQGFWLIRPDGTTSPIYDYFEGLYALDPNHWLAVSANPSDGGRVMGGGEYAAGATATVAAVPAAGWRFDGWSGDLTGSTNPATVTMDAQRSVTARFSRIDAPAAPTALTAATMSIGRIDLAWTDNATTETGFRIERKTGAGGAWAQIATVGANVTTYSNTGLAMGTTYVYRVCAFSAAGDSVYSNEAVATTYATRVPTNLTATAVSAGQISLNWTDNAGNEDGYSVERKTGAAGAWSEIERVGANVTVYADSGLAAGTTYYYRVRGYTATGYSAYSNQATATTMTLPAAPSGLTAATMSIGRIDLAWTDNATTETGFRIERKTGAGGAWAQVAMVGANVTAYSNTGLAMGTTYVYRVCAFSAAGDSTYSNEATAATYAMPVPTKLKATAVSSSQIDLAWTDNATNEDGYSIERKTGAAGTWAEVATVGVNVTTYSDTGLAAGTTYYYRVRGYNANGYSAYSNQASATTAATPAAPSGLTATTMSVGRIDLAWTDNATTETGFRIERKTGAGGAWAQIATVGANVTSYSNIGLAMGTMYVYRVRAYNAAGDSAYSNEATAATYAMPVPTNLKAAAVSASQIGLNWTDNATNEDGYSIERKTGTAGTWAEIATVGPNVTTYSDTGLAARTTYYYRVRGYNANGYSAYSNQATATTSSS